MPARLKREPEREIGGSRGYSNESFSIFHYMGRFFRAGRWDEIEAAYAPGEIDYDSYVFGHGVAIYQNTVQKRIYKPLGIKARCNEVDFDDDNYALFYNSPDSAKGYFLNPQDKSGCATGGVVMSARDMGKFLHALTHTDQIVSQENHANLLAVSTDELCGWNGSNEMADGGLAFHKAGARTMNGTSIPGNTRTGKVGATIIAYPNGMSAVLVHNSGSGADKKRRAMLADAYSAGLG